MLLAIIHWLQTSLHIHVPIGFSHYSTRMVLAAVFSLLSTIFFGPGCIKKLYEMKLGQAVSRLSDVPMLKQLHEKKKDTPTMGGVLLLTPMVLSAILFMDWNAFQTPILIGVTLALALIGGIDDYFKLKKRAMQGLSSRNKCILQCFIALIFSYFLFIGLGKSALMYYIPFYKHPIVLSGIGGAILFYSASVFVLVGSSNAVNLTDGLDGLASGLVVMVASVFALFGFVSNNVGIAEYLNIPFLPGAGDVAVFMAATSGACLGFLWYNGYPAQVFMGDIGSLTLGGVLAAAALLLRRELLLALIGGVFVVETISVILQVASYRLRNKKRIFLCAPLHHHFEYKGWPETKVVVRFWIVGLLLALIGLGSIKFQ